jgi:putative chitinase
MSTSPNIPAIPPASTITPPASTLPAVTTDIVRKMFPVTPLAHIIANLPPVLNALTTANLADKQMVLMALATIRAETESFVPCAEGQSKYNTSPGGAAFCLYDNRHDLGNQGPPDGASFRGRGFVQLTGRANYTHFAAVIGHDLVNNPDLACDPDIAAQLLATFLAAKQTAIRHALSTNDLAAARRLVNGGSNGLDRFTDAYQRGMRLIPGA